MAIHDEIFRQQNHPASKNLKEAHDENLRLTEAHESQRERDQKELSRLLLMLQAKDIEMRKERSGSLCGVKVFLRQRPTTEKTFEKEKRFSILPMECDGEYIDLNGKRTDADKFFEKDSSNCEVFEALKLLVQAALDGKTVFIVSYGNYFHA